MTIQIVSRADWDARPPKRRHTIGTPTPELWLHHTAGSSRGAAGMRAIQRFHMNTRGWSDIAYSFVIDPDTLIVYEGRGAGIAGGHTKDHNTISHAVCVMGNFNQQHPTIRLVDLIADFVVYGHERGWWPIQLTGGHRDASGANTDCPGHHLHKMISTINQLALAKQDDTMKPYQLEAVERIQKALLEAGYNLGPTGVDRDPGPLTATAVEHAVADLKSLKSKVAALVDINSRVAALVDINSRLLANQRRTAELITEALIGLGYDPDSDE